MASTSDATPPGLGDVLVSQGAITRAQLLKAVEAQKENPISLGRILVQMGYLSEKARIKALQLAFGLELYDPASMQADAAASEAIPRPFAEKHRIFPLRREGKEGKMRLLVAMEDPSDAVVLDAVAHNVQMEIRPLIATSADLNALFQGSAPGAPPLPKPPKPRGPIFKALRLGFLPVFAFGPLFLFFILLKFSADFSSTISDNVKSKFDAIIWVGLGWGTWTVIIWYINDVFFAKKDDEE